MRKTVDFLKALHELKAWSDSEIARQLGVTPGAVWHWQSGRKTLDADNAVRVAELLEIEPEYVLACMQAERHDTELARPFFDRLVERARGPKALRLYRQIARAGAKGRIVPLVAAALLSGVYTVPADGRISAGAEQCILSKIKRLRRKAA